MHSRLARKANRYRGDASAEVVTARVINQFATAGSLVGGGDTYAERWGDNPVLVFLVADAPVRGDIYAFATTEVYAVDQLEPVDGVTVSAVCVRLKAGQYDAEAIEPPTDA